MRSNNPIFNRAEGFNKAPSVNMYGNTTYAGNGAGYTGFGTPQAGGTTFAPTAPTPVMTMDSVVRASAITFGTVLVTAILTWVLTPALTRVVDDTTGKMVVVGDYAPLFAALTVGSGLAFVMSLVNSFKRTISPALVIVFAAAEGVAIGAISKFVDVQFAHGIVIQAVLGTFAAFAGTLAAYKYFNIKVGNKFRTGVIAAMFGMVGLAMIDLVMGIFGGSTHLFGFSGIGMITAVLGIVIGVFMLILDYDQVENGIANGLPESESWRAAFGLTVSLVWIYTNLLRLLSILNQR
ncbi:membrane protein [Nocardioides baekrokdamisoli]|uniref:Membrane protein n=1 Tax=Nocardioides baekrokdamisoli TaxID=1804624 RepID=A0A3G9J4N4_9ACTN|nr:Bax inhibitor-1/YccA family protein [Nocardioides baekrokdamisoli]BBH17989.1 membrane protein [Nocardioides baekrokdamisoli]